MNHVYLIETITSTWAVQRVFAHLTGMQHFLNARAAHRGMEHMAVSDEKLVEIRRYFHMDARGSYKLPSFGEGPMVVIKRFEVE